MPEGLRQCLYAVLTADQFHSLVPHVLTLHQPDLVRAALRVAAGVSVMFTRDPAARRGMLVRFAVGCAVAVASSVW